MSFIHQIQNYFSGHELPALFLSGFVLIGGYFAGKSSKFIKLPSIIGYMVIGVLLGPSLMNIFNHEVQQDFSFITELALGFVAFSIGLELSLNSLKKQGIGIISIILAESFAAFAVTTLGIYLLTKNLALAVIFGSFAPASAPAGTVAVIKEYRAKGSLTKALYAVVGFDDGLAIIIFGFAASFVKMLLSSETGSAEVSIISSLLAPLKEIILSLLTGIILSIIFSLISRKVKNKSDLLILIAGFVMLANGLCVILHLSLILTNMIIGLVIVNTQRHELVAQLGDVLSEVMPLFFVLFFALAGANLHISALPSLGAIGIVYILCRSGGLIGGASLGGMFGHVESKIKKYVGLGILSQAGVAIGLSLIVKHELQGMGKVVETVNGVAIHTGDKIGSIGITTITATCLFFEVIGPILTKVALTKAGEIEQA